MKKVLLCQHPSAIKGEGGIQWAKGGGGVLSLVRIPSALVKGGIGHE